MLLVTRQPPQMAYRDCFVGDCCGPSLSDLLCIEYCREVLRCGSEPLEMLPAGVLGLTLGFEFPRESPSCLCFKRACSWLAWFFLPLRLSCVRLCFGFLGDTRFRGSSGRFGQGRARCVFLGVGGAVVASCCRRAFLSTCPPRLFCSLGTLRRFRERLAARLSLWLR